MCDETGILWYAEDSNTDDQWNFQDAFGKQLQNFLAPLLLLGLMLSSLSSSSSDQKEVIFIPFLGNWLSMGAFFIFHHYVYSVANNSAGFCFYCVMLWKYISLVCWIPESLVYPENFRIIRKLYHYHEDHTSCTYLLPLSPVIRVWRLVKQHSVTDTGSIQ